MLDPPFHPRARLMAGASTIVSPVKSGRAVAWHVYGRRLPYHILLCFAGDRRLSSPRPDILDALGAGAPPRYTALALPAYRFVPGVQPHPVTDPRGHSYGREPRFAPAPMDGRRWRDSPGYLYGCDLYNRGFWWEAHEAWEAIWHLAARDSAERAALQGLIQVANGHLKLHMGRLRAVARLQRSYSSHFDHAVERVGMPFLGLDLLAFRTGADAYHDLAGRPEPAHDPARYPYLVLPVDDARAERAAGTGRSHPGTSR